MEKDVSNSSITKSKTEVKGTAALNAWMKGHAEKLEKRVGKRDWWIRVPKKWWLNDLEKLSPVERCVLITLKIHANKEHIAWPSTRTMAKQLKISQHTILRTIKKLKKKGFIKITRTAGRFNSYFLNGEAC